MKFLLAAALCLMASQTVLAMPYGSSTPEKDAQSTLEPELIAVPEELPVTEVNLDAAKAVEEPIKEVARKVDDVVKAQSPEPKSVTDAEEQELVLMGNPKDLGSSSTLASEAVEAPLKAVQSIQSKSVPVEDEAKTESDSASSTLLSSPSLESDAATLKVAPIAESVSSSLKDGGAEIVKKINTRSSGSAEQSDASALGSEKSADSIVKDSEPAIAKNIDTRSSEPASETKKSDEIVIPKIEEAIARSGSAQAEQVPAIVADSQADNIESSKIEGAALKNAGVQHEAKISEQSNVQASQSPVVLQAIAKSSSNAEAQADNIESSKIEGAALKDAGVQHEAKISEQSNIQASQSPVVLQAIAKSSSNAEAQAENIESSKIEGAALKTAGVQHEAEISEQSNTQASQSPIVLQAIAKSSSNAESVAEPQLLATDSEKSEPIVLVKKEVGHVHLDGSHVHESESANKGEPLVKSLSARKEESSPVNAEPAAKTVVTHEKLQSAPVQESRVTRESEESSPAAVAEKIAEEAKEGLAKVASVGKEQIEAAEHVADSVAEKASLGVEEAKSVYTDVAAKAASIADDVADTASSLAHDTTTKINEQTEAQTVKRTVDEQMPIDIVLKVSETKESNDMSKVAEAPAVNVEESIKIEAAPAAKSSVSDQASGESQLNLESTTVNNEQIAKSSDKKVESSESSESAESVESSEKLEPAGAQETVELSGVQSTTEEVKAEELPKPQESKDASSRSEDSDSSSGN